jgi:hypothetical protein
MNFIKKDNIEIINGGYVVQKETQAPIYHKDFIDRQIEAHALVVLSNKVQGADFIGKPPVSFAEIQIEVSREIRNETKRTYVSTPIEPESTIRSTMAKEAMDWLKFDKDKTASEKVNQEMQKFNIIQEFEEFGLYFNTENIVKLNKIYTIEEITKAITIILPHLEK